MMRTYICQKPNDQSCDEKNLWIFEGSFGVYNNLILVSLVLISIIVGCKSEKRSDRPETWSEDQLEEWFGQQEWLGETELQPDASIDKEEFALRYHRNKEHWDMAFTFLIEEELSTLEVGNHELKGRDVYVIVSEYDSKEPDDVQHESHKIYTDIHYVVSGTEYIRLSDISEVSLSIPYDEERDIAFYNVEQGHNLHAHPGVFFIFFPGTIHSPGLNVDGSIPVKKIVVKVKN